MKNNKAKAIYILTTLVIASCLYSVMRGGRFAAVSCVFAAVCAFVANALIYRHKGEESKYLREQSSYAAQYLLTVTAITLIFIDTSVITAYEFALWQFLLLQITVMAAFCSMIVCISPQAAQAIARRKRDKDRQARVKLMLADLRFISGKFPENTEQIGKLTMVVNAIGKDTNSQESFELKAHEKLRALADYDPAQSQAFARACLKLCEEIENRK